MPHRVEKKRKGRGTHWVLRSCTSLSCAFEDFLAVFNKMAFGTSDPILSHVACLLGIKDGAKNNELLATRRLVRSQGGLSLGRTSKKLVQWLL